METTQNLKQESTKEITPEIEFNRMVNSNNKVKIIAKEHKHKFKQLEGRYEELSVKMEVKLNETKNKVKQLQSCICDVSDMKQVMKLLKLEFKNAAKDYKN